MEPAGVNGMSNDLSHSARAARLGHGSKRVGLCRRVRPVQA